MTDVDHRMFAWFQSYYAAHFSKLTKDDGLEHWQAWIFTCSRGTLQATIDELSAPEKPRKYKPKLGDMKLVYNAIAKRHRELTQLRMAQERQAATCERCQGAGILYIILEHKDGEKYLKVDPGGNGEYEIIPWPCSCPAGREHNDKLVPMDDLFEQVAKINRGWEKAFKTKEEAEQWLTN